MCSIRTRTSPGSCSQAESVYDTRYDGWVRELYQVGAEIGVIRHFRVEPSVARQLADLPSPFAKVAHDHRTGPEIDDFMPVFYP
jgi:hypothetical protein